MVLEVIVQYWYMFFVCIGITAVATSAGIGGATFFIPFVLIMLDVPVREAIAIGIFVEIFGFTSAVYHFWKAGSIHFRLARATLMFALPATVAGVLLHEIIAPTVLEYAFVFALMVFATQIFIHKRPTGHVRQGLDKVGAVISATGGLLLGFLSSGLGEANEYNFFIRNGKSPAMTAGTSVFVVAIAAVVATATQIFVLANGDTFGRYAPYTALIIYSALGAVVGSYIGSLIAHRFGRNNFRLFISGILYAVAIATFLKAFSI